MDTKQWRLLIKKLRRAFPTERPVQVRFRKAKSNYGTAYFSSYGYKIAIDSSQSVGGQIDTLLHEWAHVYAIDQAAQHKGNWGHVFAEIYESWTRDFE
jgi:hypothetical protein